MIEQVETSTPCPPGRMFRVMSSGALLRRRKSSDELQMNGSWPQTEIGSFSFSLANGRKMGRGGGEICYFKNKLEGQV